ncbi:L,D-transpeptidase family protein [Actinospica robiniae]|uniref:L,D-transpeptidase family protein n=1 Tax=Actinospica robiniae TaxID=304901 RepID=UPI00040C2710|nr:L,D-transpeptidase family protein [Actinospica robiniae]
MRPLLRAASAIAVVGALTAGCASVGGHGAAGPAGSAEPALSNPPDGTATASSSASGLAPASSSASSSSVPTAPGTGTTQVDAALPNLGPATLAKIPANSREVVEVVGDGPNSPDSTLVLYQLTADGWQAGPQWAAHNALHGWTAHKQQGDLRSPIGVFGLTDAGGRDADPGSKLPYYRSANFVIGGRGFEGEPLAGSFDYVIAINYNRKAGASPLDDTYPLGWEKGTGVWIHVDHGGPTHGCVSIPRADIITLLGLLDPAQHPVVVMGDAADLAH